MEFHVAEKMISCRRKKFHVAENWLMSEQKVISCREMNFMSGKWISCRENEFHVAKNLFHVAEKLISCRRKNFMSPRKSTFRMNMGLLYKRVLCLALTVAHHTCVTVLPHCLKMCRSPITKGIRREMFDPIISNSFPVRYYGISGTNFVYIRV